MFCGMCADLTAAMIPRSVTMALALPIASQLHASAGITALGVMLTGLAPLSAAASFVD